MFQVQGTLRRGRARAGGGWTARQEPDAEWEGEGLGPGLGRRPGDSTLGAGGWVLQAGLSSTYLSKEAAGALGVQTPDVPRVGAQASLSPVLGPGPHTGFRVPSLQLPPTRGHHK